MPELPEVEITKQGLARVMTGKRGVQGTKVLTLRRRAKYLWLDLSSNETLISHLGMSGRFVIEPSGLKAAPLSHEHVVFEMEDGTTIRYCDPRRFGLMDLCSTHQLDQHRLFANLGVEPLGNRFHADYLIKALKGKKTPIKSALLDQAVIAGLGNIYVCEALFRAHISPRRKAYTVAGKRAETLVPIIREVLNEAIAAGGSSLKDFASADGDLGYFQTNFSVYGREDEPCRSPGCSGTVQRLTQAGRSTFFCSRCQR
jgi:formamidopyrimidine-DNA glycosylase